MSFARAKYSDHDEFSYGLGLMALSIHKPIKINSELIYTSVDRGFKIQGEAWHIYGRCMVASCELKSRGEAT
jgi:hypothetical protein